MFELEGSLAEYGGGATPKNSEVLSVLLGPVAFADLDRRTSVALTSCDRRLTCDAANVCDLLCVRVCGAGGAGVSRPATWSAS